LPKLTVQYADYAVWLREHLGQAEVASQIEYWRTQLLGAPGHL
jgi:hypothetical protein